jgi:hypothetical protein
VVTADRIVYLFDDNGEKRDKFSTKPADPNGNKVRLYPLSNSTLLPYPHIRSLAGAAQQCVGRDEDCAPSASLLGARGQPRAFSLSFSLSLSRHLPS